MTSATPTCLLTQIGTRYRQRSKMSSGRNVTSTTNISRFSERLSVTISDRTVSGDPLGCRLGRAANAKLQSNASRTYTSRATLRIPAISLGHFSFDALSWRRCEGLSTWSLSVFSTACTWERGTRNYSASHRIRRQPSIWRGV
jgi:hypothetical protein